MNGVKNLLGMVATEAIEGGARNHYFDESRAPKREYSESEMDAKLKAEAGASSFQFSLELIRQADGSYKWVE